MFDDIPISRGQLKEVVTAIARDIEVLQSILVESDLITLEELEKRRVQATAVIDQMWKEAEDRHLQQWKEDNPNAAAAIQFCRRVFGGDA